MYLVFLAKSENIIDTANKKSKESKIIKYFLKH